VGQVVVKYYSAVSLVGAYHEGRRHERATAHSNPAQETAKATLLTVDPGDNHLIPEGKVFLMPSSFLG
jgi:hypothetical protein